ncbi:hypothetical protein CYJ46_11790 [Corynebacterium coyleae]|uniref:hypothetical protein n=1 Tax=Corynebacterium coyleae TaxID=53374 RepID=UPI000C75E9C5|nr:hypothetical protein [Corynebacterium coyleae]PLA36864.1 hypothetical protein CYJ46_11790 [Corynebacterium coyleae]
MQTLFLIRCNEPSVRTLQLFEELSGLFGRDSIYFAVDCYSLSGSEIEEKLNRFPGNTLALDKNFVETNGLHFDSGSTGWCCGDYPLYKALEFNESWDYAWIIEPDVYLINGAMRKLIQLETRDEELVTTDYLKADPGWYWTSRFSRVLPDYEAYKMLFPLVRVSRAVTEKSFALRKEATSNSGLQKFKAPNDESIVASAAHAIDANVLDLRKEWPELFEYWGTTVRVPMGDLRRRASDPLIVHSGLENDDFMRRMLALWEKCIAGDAVQGNRMLKSLRNADTETVVEFVDKLIYWVKDRH